jgi:ferredoxin-NADP reductase
MGFFGDLIQMIKLRKLKFIEKIEETQNAVSFKFEKPDNLDFRAGQHFMFRLPHENVDDRGDRRIFSISSAPSEDFLMITTRYFGDEGSSFKKALYNMDKGDIINARGPSPLMDFYNLSDLDKTYILIAGGVGITPARSVLVENARHNTKLKGELVYCDSNEDLVFEDVLKKSIEKLENFKYSEFVKPNKLEKSDVEKRIELYPEVQYIISGSPGFSSSMKELLKDSGVNDSKIKSYEYKSIPNMGGGY